MPELATDALRALALSARNGFRWDNLDATRRTAVQAATGLGIAPDRVEKLSVGGQANLAVRRLWSGDVSIIEKTIVNPREFAIASALIGAPTGGPAMQVYHTSMRGAVLRLYLEALQQLDKPLGPEALAQVVVSFSDMATPRLSPVAPTVRDDFFKMHKAGFVRQVSALANMSEAATRTGLNTIQQQPWCIQHCDLHSHNIGNRDDGSFAVFDLGSTAMNLQGADFYKQLPKWSDESGPFPRFEATTWAGAELMGVPVQQIRRAALLYHAARHYRFARRHRSAQRTAQAAHFAALALSADR